MGYAYAGTCYGTELEAQEAQCHGSFPRVEVADGTVLNVACVGPDGSTLELARFVAAASAPAPTVEYVGVSFPTCDETALLGSAPTVAAFVEVWAYAFGGILMCYLFGLAVRQPLSMLK